MIEDLERQIRNLPPDPKKIVDAMALARRDLETARTLLSSDCDWAYNIAYNASPSGRPGSHVCQGIPSGRCEPAHRGGEVCRPLP